MFVGSRVRIQKDPINFVMTKSPDSITYYGMFFKLYLFQGIKEIQTETNKTISGTCLSNHQMRKSVDCLEGNDSRRYPENCESNVMFCFISSTPNERWNSPEFNLAKDKNNRRERRAVKKKTISGKRLKGGGSVVKAFKSCEVSVKQDNSPPPPSALLVLIAVITSSFQPFLSLNPPHYKMQMELTQNLFQHL